MTRAEERLLAKVVPCQPAAPDVVDNLDVLILLCSECLRSEKTVIPVAMDGSSIGGVASYGFYFPSCDATFCADIPGEDQSSFRAELECLLAFCIISSLLLVLWKHVRPCVCSLFVIALLPWTFARALWACCLGRLEISIASLLN